MCSHRLESIGGDDNFFDQRMGPNGFTNKGPRRFTTADFGGLIEYLRQNKVLDLFTMPMQWNNQDNGNNWVSHQVKGHGGNMQANVFFSAVKMPKGPEPYLPPTGNLIRYQKPQGKVWQTPNPEHWMAVFWVWCLPSFTLWFLVSN